ncbi:MAG: LegC family aminotransferase [Lachnospiraceae bacterium]|nr:LegC family aminotransferase [Lachnospiraceae bacterium]
MYKTNHFIPLSIPNFEGNEEKYVLDAVRQGWVSTGGAYISEFEEHLADFLNAPAVAACQSGTSALHLALLECGVCSGDSVIVPTLTFIAAVNPVKYQYAHPIFMDCDDSLCMDPIKLRKYCEEECEQINGKLYDRKRHSQIKAIIVVHVFGNMADMEAIMDTACQYGLKVIEDATEALGTKYTEGRYKGKFAGTIGDFGAYSFNGNKIITTGGGGAVTAKDTACLEHMKYLSTQAKDDPLFYVHHEVGYNYRMTNVQAAIGVAQLEELPRFIERKQRNYEAYQSLLRGCEMGKLLNVRSDIDSNRWFYSFELADDDILAEDMIKKLSKNEIQTRSIWGLIHEQRPYRNDTAYQIERAIVYQNRVINLPCSTQLTLDEIEQVVRCMKNIWIQQKETFKEESACKKEI